MRKKYYFLFLFFSCCLYGEQNQADEFYNHRVDIKHIEGNGIGYKTGYSSVDAFFSSSYNSYLPFIDLRAHIFNDGHFASNVGLGLRHVSKRIFGINTYYDFRQTKRKNYNQLGLGLESLGKILDFRINSYFLLGRDKSSYFSTSFHSFSGHNMILSSKRDYALSGANGEIEGHINNIKNLDLSCALGPYYLHESGRSGFGGKLRAVAEFFNCRLEGSVSYDKIFKWIAQGQLSFTIPFKKYKRKISSCSMERRSSDLVCRSEIIPLKTENKKSVAIDPRTGEPFKFWFVDNNGHSSGTFENPYNNLSTVQENSLPLDIIYVFPGDGTDRGMNSGFLLKDSQRLLGSAISHTFITTLGKIKTPILSSNYPNVSNLLNSELNPKLGFAVGVTNNCEVSGFVLRDYNNNSCIASPLETVNNCLITNNTFITLRNGIYFAPNLFTEGGAAENIFILSNNFYGIDSDVNNIRGVVISPISGTMKILNNIFGANAPNGGFSNSILIDKAFSSKKVFLEIKNNNINSLATFPNSNEVHLQNASNGNMAIDLCNNYVHLPAGTNQSGIYIVEDAPIIGFPGKTIAIVTKNISIVTPPDVGYNFVNFIGIPEFLQVTFYNNIGTREDFP